MVLVHSIYVANLGVVIESKEEDELPEKFFSASSLLILIFQTGENWIE